MALQCTTMNSWGSMERAFCRFFPANGNFSAVNKNLGWVDEVSALFARLRIDDTTSVTAN